MVAHGVEISSAAETFFSSSLVRAALFVIFRMSRRRCECTVFPRVCVSVCLTLTAFPYYCTNPDVTWGMVGVPPSCALLGVFAIGARVSLLWQHSANAKCQRVLVLALINHQHLVMPMAVGLRVEQQHLSCSPAGFQQPRSCDWISFCPFWEQLYAANSWIYARYWCWRKSSGLVSLICCGICPAGPRLAWP